MANHPNFFSGRISGKGIRFFYGTMAAISMLGMILNPSLVFGGGTEDKLAERIRAYWNARSNNDFRSAYEMESPRFRKEITFEKYDELSRNATLRIPAVQIRNIIVDGDQGRADVIFHVDIGQGSIPFSIVTPPRTDQWERIDGVWYRKYYPPEALFSINQMTAPPGPR